MNSSINDDPYAGCYVLSADYYDALTEVRDKLMLMAQLAGTASSPGDNSAMLFVRRALIGQMFADLSFQLKEVLEGVEHVTTIAHQALANSVN